MRSAARSTTSPIRRRRAPSGSRSLQHWRADIDALYAGSRRRALARSCARRYATSICEREDFLAVIDGMEMDVRRGHPRARLAPRSTSIATGSRARSGGCRCASSAWSEEDGIALAHHLGRALQLTNILRDIDEDAAIGRLYLPREALQRPASTDAIRPTVLAHPALGEACDAGGRARARRISREADAIMARSPRRTVRAPRIMGEAYRVISKAWWRAAVARRASRSASRKLRLFWICLRYAII